MKKYLVILFLTVSFVNVKGQYKKYKTLDTLSLRMDSFYSKIDTLYFKNLSPEVKEQEGVFMKLLPLIGVLIGGILTWVMQIHSIKKEKNINSHSLKEAKRIQSLEYVYSSMNKLSLFDRNNTTETLSEIQTLEKYINDNGLYIDKKYEQVINNICDYYRNVANDFRTKDYEKEMQFATQFKTYFNK